MLVYRIKHDNSIVFHTQCGSRINPIAVPAASFQFRVNFIGIITALTSNDNIKFLQLFDIKSIFQHACIFTAEYRCFLTSLRGSEKDRINIAEIVFLYHTIH